MTTTIACEACRSLLSGFLDGALPAGEAERVAAHLAGCEACREELAGLERVDQAVGSLAAPVPPRAYLDEMSARVRARVGVRARARARPGRAPLWRRWAPLAAAALVAVAVLRIVDLELPGMMRKVETRAKDTDRRALELEPPPPVAPPPEAPPPEGGVVREGAAAGAASEAPADVALSPARVAEEEIADQAAEAKGEIAGRERVEVEQVPPAPPRRVTLAAPEPPVQSLARAKASPDAALRMLAPAGGVRDSAGERWAELAGEEAAAGPDLAPEVLRDLVVAYAELADAWPATAAGRDAALHAAALAVALHERTGADGDCQLARARLGILEERYAGDASADSLRAATAAPACAP